MAIKKKIPCPRCDGKGVIPRYFYNRKGICFQCWGAGNVYVKLKDNETANDAYERLRKEAKEDLASKPPKVPMPEKMRNKAFDNDLERDYYGMTPKPKREKGVGKESTVTTERGTSVQTRFKVVDARDLIASNTSTGAVNPNFPKELQPRDRSRTASKLQVEQIANNLDFSRLSDSPLASNGSPIVGKDRVVESGNGRILAVNLAYEKGNMAAAKYREQLKANAGQFGLNADDIDGIERPVLIRERISDVDRVQFTREANESSISSMSASEQAKTDAEMLSLFIIDQYEGGDLRATKNRPFVRAFMENIVSSADRSKFLTETRDRDGSRVSELSRDGEQRIKNAMFAKAYGDADLLAKKTELDDSSNVKNVLQVMEDNAVKYAKVKAEIANGHLYNHDLSESLVSAVKKADELRAKGEGVLEYLNQPSFFEPELTEEARAILYFIEKNKRSKANIDEFLNNYLEELEALGSPNEVDLFGGIEGLSNAYVTQMQLIEIAVKRVQPELLEELQRVSKNVSY